MDSFRDNVLRLALPWEGSCSLEELIEHITQTLRISTGISRDLLRSGVRTILQTRYHTDTSLALESPGVGGVTETELRALCDWPGYHPPAQCTSAADLISHEHDTDDITGDLKRRYRNIQRIDSIPQHAQKSIEWINQRKGCLTATAVAIALDEDKYKHPIELFWDKCGRGPPFLDNANVHHGRKFEEVGVLLYQHRMNVKVGEYGLIQNDKTPFIGASPDGICQVDTPDYSGYSKLGGRLLEIKFPRLRKIRDRGELNGDICPHYYYRQVETQLYALGFQECDFLQCEVEEYASYEQWMDDAHPTIPGLSASTMMERGAIIQLLPQKLTPERKRELAALAASEKRAWEDIVWETEEQRIWKSEYLYPPRLHMSPVELDSWIGKTLREFPQTRLADTHRYDRVIYWRLVKVSCHTITLKDDWEEENMDTLRQYWNYIRWARGDEEKEAGMDEDSAAQIAEARLDKIQEKLDGMEPSQTKEIFQIIHRLWLKDHPDSDLEPLYQTTNKWRTKINRMLAYYRR